MATRFGHGRQRYALFATVALIVAGTCVHAETEIHRCLQEDGTFAFQEMPCPEPAANADGGNGGEGDRSALAASDDVLDFVNPFDEPANTMPAEPSLPETVSSDRTECERSTRNAIDAIDLEMREKAYTKEQGEQYLAELLELTRQLRACKQL